MANVVIDIAAEFTGKNAFKKAESSTAGLEKGVKKLGKQLAGVFAAQKILSFGKASIKAFAADEKASKSLEIALKNTGNAFATIDVEAFIAKLQRTTGVLDDQLRPAFRTLLTATGDVKKSQEGLQLALDISAGTGKDLNAVSMALAKAYGGQTTALSRLGAGLSKATLKTGDMDVIFGELNAKFSGQAVAAVKTYSGQIAVLNVALENAKETIGKGLLDSFSMLAGSDGLNGTVSGIEKMANFISDVIKNVAFMIKKFEKLKPVILAIGAILLVAFAPVTATIVAVVALLAIAGKNLRKTPKTPMASPGSAGGRYANIKAELEQAKLLKEKNKLSKIDNANTTRKLALTGDQLALAELEKKFDVERVGLYAALNQSTDGETKMRLLSLIAIKDQNTALAGQITAAEKATSAIDAFKAALLASINALLTKTQQGVLELQKVLGVTPTTPSNSVGRTPMTPYFPGDINSGGYNLGASQFSINPSSLNSSPASVNIQISPALNGLLNIIQDSSASGVSPTLNRINSSYIA